MPKSPVSLPSPTGLYWCERGHVGCADHTPYENSDTWIWDRWMPLTHADVQAYRDAGYAVPKCETCGAEARLPRRSAT